MYIVKIERKTSEYNPRIKWFANGESEETGATFSLGFRTKKEAEGHGWRAGRVVEIKTLKGLKKNPAYN